ncbi:unnamed protein product, partial [marine sediment metagenome]
YIPEHEINVITINEQFNPLINFDMTWKNSLTSKVELKRARTLSLSLTNNQVTELLSNEIVFGAGYRFNEVQIIIRTGGRQQEFKSDLNVRADLSIRDNKTIMRRLVENIPEPTAGQRIISVKLSADYVLSDRFNLRLFYDRVVNKPFVALTFPTANTNFGFSIRFTLTQ